MSRLDVSSGLESVGGLDELRGVSGWERLLDAIPGAVLLVAPNGAIVHANEVLARLTGYAAPDLRGRAVELLVPDEARLTHVGVRTRYQRRPRPQVMGAGLDISCRRADGSTFPADVRLAPLPLGGVDYVLVTLTDESERRRREEELFHRSVHDALTGLPNRVLLLDRMAQAFSRARRQGTRVSAFYLDLDGFKAVNDRWGHAVGDEVLAAVAGRLSAVVRPADTVARLGGDEFLILCEGLGSAADATDIAARLLGAVSEPLPLPVATIRLTASVGCACALYARCRPATLLEAADQAMYRAKRAGGNAYRRTSRK